MFAPAVAVAIDVAVQVEQRSARVRGRTRSSRCGMPGRSPTSTGRSATALVSPDCGGPAGSRWSRSTAERYRAPQRHLVRRVAADHRAFHREVRDRDIGARIAVHLDARRLPDSAQAALFGIARLAKSTGSSSSKSCSPFRNASQRGWFSSMIATSTRSTIGSRRPLRRATNAAAAASPSGGVLVVAHVAIVGVALEHDARRAPPLGQPERPGADRVLP